MPDTDEQRRAWLRLTPEQRERLLEPPPRPDVSEYMKPEHDGPSLAAIAGVAVVALILAVALIAGV